MATGKEPFADYDKLKPKGRRRLPLRLPGYDALSIDQIVTALDSVDLATLKRVRAYERKFGARKDVLDEVARLHAERRVPLVSRDSTV